MTLSERMNLLIKSTGLSQIKFAQKAQVSVSVIKHIASGSQNSIDAYDLKNIAKTYGANLNWILDGEGSMLLNECENLTIFASGKDFQEDVMPIPSYNVQAAAGCGAINDNEYIKQFIPFSKRYIKEVLGILHNNLSIICARGDSMEPTLKQGDLLLIDELRRTPDDEGIYVFRREENLNVKRILILSDVEIKVISDNKFYDPFIINLKKDPIDIIGKVVWHARKVN